jgi:glycosyltransferase involved in cell wall biosynthesis
MVNLHINLNSVQFASRVLRETEGLVRDGIVDRVLIVGLYEDGLLQHDDIDAHRTIWRVRLRSKKWPKSFVVQCIKYLEFCWRVTNYASSNHIGQVNVHAVGLLPLGVWLKWRLGAKLIYDAHELETETNGLYGFRKALSKVVERTLIKFSDLTIVVSGEIERWYRNKYSIDSIVSVLNCPRYRERRTSKLLREEFGISPQRKILLYQGVLCVGRGIEFLLQSFEADIADHYVVVFMGFGELENRIRKKASRSTRIFYKPAVHPDVLLDYTSSSDVGISIIEDVSVSDYYCLPNKMFEYITARVPIVVSNLPEMRKVVNDCKIGAVMESWNSSSLFRALDQLGKMDPEELARNLDEAARIYSWEVQQSTMKNAYKTYIRKEA